jgi:hypothetical protein
VIACVFLDPEALSMAVRMQLEYYFSKENLQTDTFLTSKMDSQKSVPIEIVMGVSVMVYEYIYLYLSICI